ncbi:MAG: LacI family DNA-binding transcriptional regulator [Thermomicrobiales bacterium]
MTRPTRQRSPTITDVAKLADVSITTVSFVLNNVADRSIPDETRNRVKAAADRLGYRPNAAAKLLRTSRSHTIGFITDEIATTPFAVDIIRGAQEAAWAHGKVLIIVNTGSNEGIRDSAIEVMLERRVEGLIYAAMFHQLVDIRLPSHDVPVVLLDCVAADASVASVVPDEVGGGYTATDVLLQAGHRRIGFICLRPDIPASVGRTQGYRQALETYGVPFDPSLVRYTGDSSHDEGYDFAKELMSIPDPPTALFCGNDRTAMAAYDALKELGLRIPEGVAVVGFDNQEIIAAHLRPPLSTVALPHFDMGQWAVNYLIQATHRADEPPVQHKMPCPYVARASV